MPPHRLELKVNQPIILLRNIDPAQGLCNGTKLICRALHTYLIEAEIASGQCAGKIGCIPRVKLTSKEDGMPFELSRKQFPVKPAFAMTINKAQRSDTVPCGSIFTATCLLPWTAVCGSAAGHRL